MFAVLTTGGKQYKVSQGDRLRVEKIDAPVGEKVELTNVNMLGKNDGIVVDAKSLSSAKVVAEVTYQGKGKKIERKKSQEWSRPTTTEMSSLEMSSVQFRELRLTVRGSCKKRN